MIASAEPIPSSRLPNWAKATGAPVDLSHAVFSSAAALSFLHATLTDPACAVPEPLLRARLALSAAQQALAVEGRRVDIQTLRDAYGLLAPGETHGPDGAMLALWRKSGDVALGRKGWQDRVLSVIAWDAHDVFEQDKRDPVSRACAVLCKMVQTDPRQEAAALICATAALSHALGWAHPLPVIPLSRADLRSAAAGNDIVMAFHVAVAKGAGHALREAQALARGAEALRRAVPKLRTKGAADAVALFLREDAVSPSGMLSPLVQGSDTRMTDRSARRFCDRLVTLGLARELTGRPTFRLYGLA